MKTINYVSVLFFLLITNVLLGQINNNEIAEVLINDRACSTFENDSFDGWQGLYADISIESPAMDNSNFLQANDDSGPSYIYSNSYPTNWERYKGQCLCFDYKVINDGVSSSTENINPKIYLTNNTNPLNATIRAVFVANVTVTENSPWVHVCAPIMPSDGISLPSNGQGQWANVTPAQWNALLADVQSVAFFVDMAGSAAQQEILGVDNICIQKCSIDDPEPNNEGAYCCEGENLVLNGNFEAGNVNFTSSYNNNSAVYPGEYDVSNVASAFGAAIKDHSYCADPTQYATNENFLLVNGSTQQTGNAVIWETTISGLKPEANYKFCANFKNMPQCTFDIRPNVNMEAVGSDSSGFSIISPNPAAPCDWVNKEFNFTATSTTMTLRIILDETGNGDGNDLAIDDISVTKLLDPNLTITVQHQGNPQHIVASINTIDVTDDYLPNEKCEYQWFVAEVSSYPPLVINFSTFASGNNSGNSNGNSPWNLTTTFPDYAFTQNTLYFIGMYTPVCSCYDEGLTYQLTLNNRPIGNALMSEAQEQQIIDMIKNGQKGTVQEKPVGQKNVNSELKLYPNPAQNSINILLQGDTLKSVEIFSISGQTVFTQTYEGNNADESIDVSSFASGIYLIKAQGKDGKQYNSKILKE